MNIQIPNKKISFSLLCTVDKVLYGDCLIDTDDDARGVEDKEHDDSHNEDDGEAAIFLLLVNTVLGGFRPCNWLLLHNHHCKGFYLLSLSCTAFCCY